MTERQELLYDTAAALRLVDRELSEHHALVPAATAADDLMRGVVTHASSELASVIAALRASGAGAPPSDVERQLCSLATLLDTVQ